MPEPGAGGGTQLARAGCSPAQGEYGASGTPGHVSDESLFQYPPFIRNQMTGGWRDKLSWALYPGGAWRRVLSVRVTPVLPCKHQGSIHHHCTSCSNIPNYSQTVLPTGSQVPLAWSRAATPQLKQHITEGDVRSPLRSRGENLRSTDEDL